MIVRLGLLLSCVTLVVAQGQPAFAATPSQVPPPPQRILLVGDSTAETIYPFLRDAVAGRSVDVESAARIGCSVIDGDPKLDDGRPYIDYYGDTTRCAALTGGPGLEFRKYAPTSAMMRKRIPRIVPSRLAAASTSAL